MFQDFFAIHYLKNKTIVIMTAVNPRVIKATGQNNNEITISVHRYSIFDDGSDDKR